MWIKLEVNHSETPEYVLHGYKGVISQREHRQQKHIKEVGAINPGYFSVYPKAQFQVLELHYSFLALNC